MSSFNHKDRSRRYIANSLNMYKRDIGTERKERCPGLTTAITHSPLLNREISIALAYRLLLSPFLSLERNGKMCPNALPFFSTGANVLDSGSSVGARLFLSWLSSHFF